MATHVTKGPRWRKAYENLSRTRLALPTMSLSPPSEKHRFPPADLLDTRKPNVVAKWDALQPPPNSALVALAHRMGIASIFSNGSETGVDNEAMSLLLRQACTHDSFAREHVKMYPNESTPPTNGMLASLGNSLLGMFAAEHLNASYPHLPTRVLKAAASAYVGHQTCANVAVELGIAPLVRWHRKSSSVMKPAITHADALASVPRAITALIYHHRSLSVARKFAHTFFLSRLVDLKAFIKFRDPKLALSFTVEQFGRERPISRLLRESGRASNSPIYVVGIFSGVDKLGEGFGSSLRMAEYRAAEDAMQRLYLTKVPSDLVALPTAGFPSPLPKQRKSVFDHSSPSLPTVPYTPFTLPTPSKATTTIGYSEILYGTNDEKDPNVVEDLKRPWWRPAKRPPITKPLPEAVVHKVARRDRMRLRSVVDGRTRLLEKKKTELKRGERSRLSSRSQRTGRDAAQARSI